MQALPSNEKGGTDVNNSFEDEEDIDLDDSSCFLKASFLNENAQAKCTFDELQKAID